MARAADIVRVGAAAQAYSFSPIEVGNAAGIYQKLGLDVQKLEFSGAAKLNTGIIADADARQHFPRAVGAAHAAHQPRCEHHVLQYGHVRVQAEPLEHHADLGAEALGAEQPIGEHFAQHLDPPVLDPLQPVDAAEQRALAGSAGTADHHDAAGRDRQVDVAQHAVVAEGLADALEPDDRRAQRYSSHARTAALMKAASSGLTLGLPARWPQMLGIGRSSAWRRCAISASLSATRK